MRISSLSRRTRVRASEMEMRMVSAPCAVPFESGATSKTATRRRREIIEETTGTAGCSLDCKGPVSYRGLGGSALQAGRGTWDVEEPRGPGRSAREITVARRARWPMFAPAEDL